jgi:hypothetical protein
MTKTPDQEFRVTFRDANELFDRIDRRCEHIINLCDHILDEIWRLKRQQQELSQGFDG